MRLARLLVLTPVLAGCYEPAGDVGVVYVVPTACTCDLDYYDCGPACPEGSYPADTAFEVVYGIPASGIEIRDERCEVEESGPFELTVTTSWRVADREDIGTLTYFECEDRTPPLAAGTWTIIHGEATATLEIPSPTTTTLCLYGVGGGVGWDCTEAGP